MKGTTEAAAPLRHYKENKYFCLHHAGAAIATIATLPSVTVTVGRECTFPATPRGLAMPVEALAITDGVGGRQGEERNERLYGTKGPGDMKSSALRLTPYQSRGALPTWTSPS
jgi:hypothetical protein